MKKQVSVLIKMKSKILLFFIVLFLFFPCADKKTMAEGVKEYAVKAAFVFNFTKFINWPEESFKDNKNTYQLYFIGDNTIAREFNKLNGKSSGQKTIDVHRLFPHEKCRKCDIIFISRDMDRMAVKKIISRLKGKPVLTIGETEEFTKLGGVISFFIENDHLHFKINTRAAAKQGLKFSSRLLRLAVIVDGSQ